MKKLNLVTVLSLTAGLAFAWNTAADENASTIEKYGVYYTNEDVNSEWIPRHQDEQGNWIEGHRASSKGAWYIENAVTPGVAGEPAKGDTKSTLFKSVANDAVLSISLERNKNTNPFAFGTFTYNEDGSVNLSDALGSVTGKDDLGLSFYNTGKFDKDKLVGIWIQELDKDGNPIGDFYYSRNPVTLQQSDLLTSGQYTEGYGNWIPDPTDPTGETAIETGVASVWFDIYNNGVWGGQDVNGVELGLTEIKFRVTGAAPDDANKFGTPTGGPLPGVWATIALAGAASAYLRRRKNK